MPVSGSISTSTAISSGISNVWGVWSASAASISSRQILAGHDPPVTTRSPATPRIGILSSG